MVGGWEAGRQGCRKVNRKEGLTKIKQTNKPIKQSQRGGIHWVLKWTLPNIVAEL